MLQSMGWQRVRCDPMNRSTPGLPVHQQLLEFTQTHVHRVSDAIQPGDLPNPGIEPKSLSPALAGRFFTTAPTGRPNKEIQKCRISVGCARV